MTAISVFIIIASLMHLGTGVFMVFYPNEVSQNFLLKTIAINGGTEYLSRTTGGN
jgi:hypothetical protein